MKAGKGGGPGIKSGSPQHLPLGSSFLLTPQGSVLFFKLENCDPLRVVKLI